MDAMDSIVTAIVAIALFVGVLTLLWLGYRGWRRLTAREGDLQIWQALRRSGLSAEDAAAQPGQLGHAVRRCVMCPSIEECDHWLASGKREGLDEFCPNATYFDALKGKTVQPAKR